MVRGAGILRGVLFVLAVGGAAPVPLAWALPRYSARFGQSCALCHVNPTGGGMRTLYASQDIVPREFSWTRSPAESLTGLNPRISPNVTVGTDFREMYIGTRESALPRGFFQMQADLYLSFQVDGRTTLYYDKGINGSYELFAYHYFTPGLYAKAGRFVPSEGWKYDDHTMFVRADLGFMPPANSDVGLEVGALRGGLDVQAAVLNGNRGGTANDDQDLAGAVNAVYRFTAGPANLALGGTGYHRPTTANGTVDVAGTYGYASAGRFTWVGQGDLEWSDTTGPTVRSLVTSHELSVALHRGLDALGTYDYLDPDTDRDTGTTRRWGGGLTVMPTPYAVVEALYRSTRENSPDLPLRRTWHEALVQLHVLY